MYVPHTYILYMYVCTCMYVVLYYYQQTEDYPRNIIFKCGQYRNKELQLQLQ
jgi:hypothetical protein